MASLSAEAIERLAPNLVLVELERGRILHEAGEPVTTVYFLEQGICSVVVTMKNGSTVEAGIIGRDAFVGIPAVLGTGQSSNRAYIQLPGSGFSIKAKILREQMSHPSGELRSCLFRAMQGILAQTAQTAACNRVHELEERLARWLLMCHDRVQIDRLPITHELLAIMLGTRRSTVTVTAGILQKAGLIESKRGNVTIRNRKGLEEATCECYSFIHDEYIRLGLL
ncbi:MAG: Crp/Fnr family transcriptional regulator [Terracidiphilus sp.]